MCWPLRVRIAIRVYIFRRISMQRRAGIARDSDS
jgi:hypothetical protein